jgi:hypothetical protein
VFSFDFSFSLFHEVYELAALALLELCVAGLVENSALSLYYFHFITLNAQFFQLFLLFMLLPIVSMFIGTTLTRVARL